MDNSKIFTPIDKKKQLRDRVHAIKHLLPKNFRTLIISKYPEYDTYKGTTLLNNVLNGKSSDETLTDILEKIVDGTL